MGKTLTAAAKRPRRLKDAALAHLALRFARLARLRKRAELRREEIQAALLAQLEIRETAKLQLDDLSITRAQARPAVWYDAALLQTLKPRQRKAVTRETLDLNQLPAELRARVEASLSKAERAAITTRSLDEAALLAEVEAGRIDAEVIAPHRQTREKAPYIVVTGA